MSETTDNSQAGGRCAPALGSESFDTAHRDAPICPHCGHAQRDAWEINFGPGIEGDTEIDCGECEKTFMVSRHSTITYSTQKLSN